MPGVLDQLRSTYTTTQERYRTLESIVTADGHEISEIEQQELDHLAESLRSMQPRIEGQVELERSLAAGGNALANLPVHQPSPQQQQRRREPHPVERFRSWAEYAGALSRGEVDRETYDLMQGVIVGTEVTHDIQRAFVDVTTADVAGIVPPQWITSIAETIDASRPLIDAFSSMPLPDTGMTLTYPQIVTRPLVGKQSAQKTDIPSRKTVINPVTAPVSTYGGGEDVSVQVLQRTEPNYLGLMLQLYAEQMSIAMDVDAIAAFETAVTTAAVNLSKAAPVAWNGLLATAIAAMLQASHLLPDVFVMGTTLWGNFAGASDADGRPLFPNINALNPVGQLTFTDTSGEVRGLTVAVDPNMAPTHGIIGARQAFTSFTSGTQTMNSFNPSKLGQDYAVYSFAAFAARRPDAAIKVLAVA